jgi:hypothetical protein
MSHFGEWTQETVFRDVVPPRVYKKTVKRFSERYYVAQKVNAEQYSRISCNGTELQTSVI